MTKSNFKKLIITSF